MVMLKQWEQWVENPVEIWDSDETNTEITNWLKAWDTVKTMFYSTEWMEALWLSSDFAEFDLSDENAMRQNARDQMWAFSRWWGWNWGWMWWMWWF